MIAHKAIKKATHHHRRGSVIIVVVWAIAICALLVSSLMVFAGRQSMLGHETLDHIRARWAARAGVEETIAVMAYHTLQPEPNDALAINLDMEGVNEGETDHGEWSIFYNDLDGKLWPGPMDEHMKLNVNGDGRGYLAVIFSPLSWGVSPAIEDWIDEDDDPRDLGVEKDYYLSLDSRYEPRNNFLWHIAEMELIAGLDPEDIRGEDWNLNNRLDDNENDGEGSMPNDEPDDRLDGGWSAYLTASSLSDGATVSGLPRLYFPATTAEELVERTGLDPAQASMIMSMAAGDDFTLESLINTPLTDSDGGDSSITPLEDWQLTALFDETTVNKPHQQAVGKLNLNTVPRTLLLDMYQGQEDLVENILSMRRNRAEGITSIMDLRELPGMTDDQLVELAQTFTTRSNVYTITSRGRSGPSGAEVEIVTVVDRSTVPVQIVEYREE
ncbi:MAG: general secretion pathway protein GspK [Phycisphaerales bacterium]|nr:general secretion pathway protein GspK [Phycisphaerales bacterium]